MTEKAFVKRLNKNRVELAELFDYNVGCIDGISEDVTDYLNKAHRLIKEACVLEKTRSLIVGGILPNIKVRRS